MTGLVWACALFTLLATLLHVASTLLAVYRLRRKSTERPPSAATHVSVLRPVRGLDPYDEITLRSDSQLFVNQLLGRYRVRAAHLVPLYERARALVRGFRRVRFEHVPREQNRDADRLANAAVDAWLAGDG